MPKPQSKIINEKNFCVIAGKNSEAKNLLRGGINQYIFLRTNTYKQKKAQCKQHIQLDVSMYEEQRNFSLDTLRNICLISMHEGW